MKSHSALGVSLRAGLLRAPLSLGLPQGQTASRPAIPNARNAATSVAGPPIRHSVHRYVCSSPHQSSWCPTPTTLLAVCTVARRSISAPSRLFSSHPITAIKALGRLRRSTSWSLESPCLLLVKRRHKGRQIQTTITEEYAMNIICTCCGEPYEMRLAGGQPTPWWRAPRRLPCKFPWSWYHLCPGGNGTRVARVSRPTPRSRVSRSWSVVAGHPRTCPTPKRSPSTPLYAVGPYTVGCPRIASSPILLARFKSSRTRCWPAFRADDSRLLRCYYRSPHATNARIANAVPCRLR